MITLLKRCVSFGDQPGVKELVDGRGDSPGVKELVDGRGDRPGVITLLKRCVSFVFALG